MKGERRRKEEGGREITFSYNCEWLYKTPSSTSPFALPCGQQWLNVQLWLHDDTCAW